MVFTVLQGSKSHITLARVVIEKEYTTTQLHSIRISLGMPTACGGTVVAIVNVR